jgi:uncharacterized iron-regulated membrane protein
MKPAVRKPLLTFHVWLGLTAGLVLLLVAVTGSMLLFRGKLERRLDPQRFIVQPGTSRMSLDELASRARAAHPAAELESFRFYGDPTMPVMVLFSNKEYVHLHPATGAVLGIRQRYGEGFGWIESLHKYLTLDPSVGENVNGSLAFVFTAFILAGLALWWPATRRALKAGLTLNPKLKGRPWYLNLHKTLGIYAALLILFSATSGIPIALDSTRAVLYWFTGSTKEAPPTPALNATKNFVGFEAIAQGIAAQMPGAQETYIGPPKNGLVVTYAIAADAAHPNARSYMWFDAGTAALVRFTPYEKASMGFQAYYWILSLHTGVTGGWVVQLLLLLGTLSVPVLAYTGIASYFRRKSRATSTAPAPVPTVAHAK